MTMSDLPTTSVDLVDDELLLLDGRCSAKVQAEVDGAKLRQRLAATHQDVPPQLLYAASTILRAAASGGQLIRRGERIRHCLGCGKHAGYAARTRSSSKGLKGEPNYDRPLYLSAIEYVPQFVRVVGYSSTAVCLSCVPEVERILISELAGVPCDLPDALVSEGGTRWRRYERRHCTACGWQGHEGQMRQLPALISGRYAGGCPACPANNTPFGPTVIKNGDGFELVEIGSLPENSRKSSKETT